MPCNVFEPITIGGVKVNNRIIRAATHECMADEFGLPTNQLNKIYKHLAAGGIGAIITGYMAVSKDAVSKNPGMLMLDSDDKIPYYSKMVSSVHKSGCSIIAQLNHCGRQGIMGRRGTPDNLTEPQIKNTINDFVNCAVRAYNSGFDAIELHCAHGYLLSSMLSASENHRKDKYGGTIRNRSRMVVSIIRRIKEKLPNYPIWVKINGFEKSRKGIKVPEAVFIAKKLCKYGASAIEVSSYTFGEGLGPVRGDVPVDMILLDFPIIKDAPSYIKKWLSPIIKITKKTDLPQHLYNVPAAKKIKQAIECPVIVCGGIRTKSHIEKVLNSGSADAVSMCRPLILEPDLVNKYKNGLSDKPLCIECNYCLIGVLSRGLRCYYGEMPGEI